MDDADNCYCLLIEAVGDDVGVDAPEAIANVSNVGSGVSFAWHVAEAADGLVEPLTNLVGR
jgi:hypothetical protein